jgi:predicted metal-dependent enzyme (double-stranded beta helix superfamily)
VPDAAAGGSPATPGNGTAAAEAWPWPQTLDAVIAAPGSHRVLIDNERVRVLEVVIEPGTREPEHTHQAFSVMLIDEPANIRYFVGNELRFESRQATDTTPATRVHWMEPEGPHSVENIDQHRYHAIRVELK